MGNSFVQNSEESDMLMREQIKAGGLPLGLFPAKKGPFNPAANLTAQERELMMQIARQMRGRGAATGFRRLFGA